MKMALLQRDMHAAASKARNKPSRSLKIMVNVSISRHFQSGEGPIRGLLVRVQTSWTFVSSSSCYCIVSSVAGTILAIIT